MTRRLRSRRTGDDGFALVAVLGTMVVLTAFLLGTLGYALRNAQPSRDDQDAKAALAAAQAGIEEYVAQLRANDTYFTNNGVAPANPAFDGDGDGIGRAVPGTGGAGATFRYKLLTSAQDVGRFGVIRLKVTGTSGRVSRDLVAELQPDGFLKYIYFTDLEAGDPALFHGNVKAKKGASATYDTGTDTWYELRPASSPYDYYVVTWTIDVAKYDELCANYWYAGRNNPTYTSGTYYERVQGYKNGAPFGSATTTARSASATDVISFACTEVRFVAGDEINGPLHSNDALQVQGAVVFGNERTESSWDTGAATNTATPAAGGLWWGSGTPSASGFKPQYAARVAMPVGNTTLRDLAAPVTPDSPDRGCLYTGDTRITFVDDKVKVLSPLTTSSVPRCYNTATPGVEQTLTSIPAVMYVQAAASSASCTTGAVGYPKTGEVWSGNTYTTQYDCRKGNAFVSGRLSGRVTVGTSNDIVVVGDTTYLGGTTGTDALGLIPQDYAWVYHPVKSDGTNLLTNAQSPHNLDAAVLSVRRSFLAQNYFRGALISTTTNVDDGTKLKIRGAVAQKYRGAVGTPGDATNPAAGYVKLYEYDTRLQYAPPPYFLRPDASPWRVRKVSD